MKVLIPILFILLCCKATGQNYYNFPLSNTIWNIYLNNIWYNTNTEMKRYAFFNDTIEINNKVYSKLYDINDTTLNCSNATYLFPFREDSSKKVYFLYDTTEVLIYDFSINIGDTIFYNYLIQGALTPYEHFKRLDSIASVEINAQIRNIYYLSGGLTGNTWIEGIGAIDGEGLFAPVSGICLCGELLNLACVKQNDSVLWVNNPICSRCFCNLYVSMSDNEINNKINIYPNPANDKLNIDIEEKAFIEIINVQGQILETKSLVNKTNVLDISKLSSGIYTLRIKTDKGISVRKLIKQ